MRAATLLITPYIIIWLLTRSRRSFRWIFFTALLTIQLFSLIPLLIIGIVILKQPAPIASTMHLVGLYSNFTITNSQLHGLSGWEGVDIKAGCGEPIYAPFDGTVTYNGLDGYSHLGIYEQATMLTIKNDDLELTLLHGDYDLPVGGPVKARDVIGRENSHGWSTGCHSHVILKENGRLVNYLEWERLSRSMLASVDSYHADYLYLVRRISASYDIEPEFIMGIIQQESAWDARATSSAGAMGLMQLMPGTAADMGVSDAYNPEQNIRGGIRYINWLLNRYNGDKRTALMAYHAGPGNIDQRGATSLDIYYANQVMGYYEGYLDE